MIGNNRHAHPPIVSAEAWNARRQQMLVEGKGPYAGREMPWYTIADGFDADFGVG
jgi:predicted dithiol-disulfide oxidoreductase (DUF899 family)